MAFKFEKLEVWQLAMELTKRVYSVVDDMPKSEIYNLSSQIKRAVTSVQLNIAEGSTSQTDPEQLRFLGYTHRSLMEVVSCFMLTKEHQFIDDNKYRELYTFSEKLSAKILAMKKAIRVNLNSNRVNDETENCSID